MADLEYKATLDVNQIIANLRQIDNAAERTRKEMEEDFSKAGKAGVDAFNKVEKAAQSTTEKTSSGFDKNATKIGVVSGVTNALTNEFIKLGHEAVRVLEGIVSRSVETAIQIDTLKARLGGIFDGSKEAADEAFTFIQDKSKELGIDLSELAGAFLPKTESLAQFERVAKIATALARSDPEQGAIGARIALIEALSGTFTSLQRRFEIPKEDIDRIKEAFDKEGIEGFLTTLETVLKESGKSFEDLANTAQTSFDKLSIAGQQLGGRLGVPIVDALEEASNKILSFLNENENDLIVFTDTIGRAIADVVSFISSIDLGQFDTRQLIEFGDYIFRVVNAVELAIQQFQLLYNSISPLTNVFGSLGFTGVTLTDVFTNIDDALVTASQILALATASFEALKAALDAVIAPFESLITAIDALNRGDVSTAAAALTQAYDELQVALYDTSIVQNAFNKSIQESQASFNAYDEAVSNNKTKQDELRDSLQQQSDAGTDAADAILAKAQADRQAAEDAEKLKEAQDKVNKAMADAQKDFNRKLEDIDKNFERKRLDIAIEFAQKREDAAEKNLEKLEDIRRKYSQDVQDAETDLNREEEDIARKFGQERLDLEKETRQKRLDIEKDYRRSLQDIQSQFLLDADEAEKNRDAIAFLRAVKERDTKVQEAQTNRQREIEDARTTQEQKREELRIQQERELEEARLANERKLEDLRLSLSRQIEEQNIAYARELEDLQEQETRKLEETQRARERDIEDAKLAYARKLEDLQESLAEELTTLKEGNALLEEEAKRHNEAMQQEESSTSDSTQSSIPATGAPFRDSGGPVSKGLPYRIGKGSYQELFVPDQSGTVLPHNALVMATQNTPSGASYSSSRKQEINIPMATAEQLLDPIFVAQLRNIIGTELGKVYE